MRLFDPQPGDTSLGAAYPDGTIQLNAHWFSAPPERLRTAARVHPVIDIDGVDIGWHGPMEDEPVHVLTHEFGHCVWNGLPDGTAEGWSEPRWIAATQDPATAPTGYGLANPVEFWAEAFAMVELGFATDAETADMMRLISK